MAGKNKISPPLGTGINYGNSHQEETLYSNGVRLAVVFLRRSRGLLQILYIINLQYGGNTTEIMEYNTKPEFVGIEQIKAKQKWQLDKFEAWAMKNQWVQIHHSHYDWWMFPIHKPSGHGFKWTVYEGEIFALKQDAVYLDNYLRGVELLAQSWGWDLFRAGMILNTHPDQKWQHWPVRLYKAALSVQLFGFDESFNSLKTYALQLMQQGEAMTYGSYDLSWLFTTGVDPYPTRKHSR